MTYEPSDEAVEGMARSLAEQHGYGAWDALTAFGRSPWEASARMVLREMHARCVRLRDAMLNAAYDASIGPNKDEHRSEDRGDRMLRRMMKAADEAMREKS